MNERSTGVDLGDDWVAGSPRGVRLGRSHSAPTPARRSRLPVLAAGAAVLAMLAAGSVVRSGAVGGDVPVHRPASVPSANLGTAGGSGTEAFWTAVVFSVSEDEGGRARAAQRAESVRTAGFDVLPVFASGTYGSLRPGYWVVASGRFGTHAEATVWAKELGDSDFTAYPRCVGTARACG